MKGNELSMQQITQFFQLILFNSKDCCIFAEIFKYKFIFMKRNFIILSAFLLFAACTNSKNLNSWSCTGLNGRVKSVKSMCYNAIERFGDVSKGEIIDYSDSDYDVPLYPAYIAEYNEAGNVVKFYTYDDDGELLNVYKNEYIGNNQVSHTFFDRDGEAFYYWKFIFENEIPTGFENYAEYNTTNEEYRDVVFDGLLLKSFSTYKDGDLVSSTERKFYKNLVESSITKDADGNVTYQFTNTWTPDGKLLHMESMSNDKKEAEKTYTYDENGYPITLIKKGNWYKGEANYTFKYTLFDKQGNWLSRVIYSNDKAYIVEERNIEYYD